MLRGTRKWTLVCLVFTGCTGAISGAFYDVGSPPGDAGPVDAFFSIDAGVEGVDAAHVDREPLDAALPPTISIESPTPGAFLQRRSVIAGEWVARVEIVVHSTGIDHIDLVVDGSAIGRLRPPDTTLFQSFPRDGEYVITALGQDARGATLVSDEVRITIGPPSDQSCHGMLDALGLEWEPIASLRGVRDPVRLMPLIAGVRYRYVSDTAPRPMSMGCELATRLVRLSELVSAHGIDEIVHLGIYNYRCVGGGNPDSGTCTPSQHAYARAIDLHAFRLRDSGETWSTEDDFVITRRADTCPMMSSSEADRGLKEIACSLWSEGIFQIVLTPNYNAAHRNHFHVDLTEGSGYLGAGVEGVDPWVDQLGD